MAAGAGAAYKGYQKIDNGMSQSLQRLTGIKAQENAAEKLADEREGVREQGRLDDWTGEHKFAPIEEEASGINEIDDLHRATVIVVNQAARAAADRSTELRYAGDEKGANKAWLEYQKIKGSIKTHSELQGKIKLQVEATMKAKDAQRISGVDSGIASYYQAVENLDTVPFMENGELKYNVIFKDAKGKTERIEVMSASEIGKGAYNFIPKNKMIGEGSLVAEAVSAIPKRTKTDVNGDYIDTNQVWDDQAQLTAEAYIDEKMQTDATMSDLLFQAGGGAKFGDMKNRRRTAALDDFTDPDRTRVRDWFVKQVKAGYGTDEDRKVRQKTVSEENAAAKKVADAKTAAKSGKGDKSGYTSDRVYYGAKTDEKDTKPNAAQFSIDKGFDVQSILPASSNLTNDELIELNYNTVVVTDKEELYLTSINADTKDLKINSSQKTAIAEMLGLKSGDDLLLEAKNVGNKKGTTTTNTSKYNK